MKVGIFGGSFNPIHMGHLMVGEGFRESLGLEKVYFVLARLTGEKKLGGGASDGDRLSLLEEGVRGNPYFEWSDIEIRGGILHTVETVRRIYVNWEDVERPIRMLIGRDLFEDLEGWFEVKELMEEVEIYVVNRGGGLEDDHGFLESGKVRLLELESEYHLSSRMIRKKVYDGESVRYLVPEGVRGLIEEKGLYRRVG